MFKLAIKRSVALILSFVLLFCNFSVDVFAKEQEISLTLETSLLAAPETRTNNDSALAESINFQLKNFNSSVDIYNFKLAPTAENQQKIVDILSGGLPECFHIGLSFSIAIRGQYISAIIPNYIYTRSEYETMLAQCDAAADKMLEDVKGNTNLSAVQKLLILHDRIALFCEYDYERYLMGKLPQISHSMYGVFINKLAVCQGYALAYSYLLDKLGIENYYVGSKALNHAWNIAYVNGKPYHIDITKDDPVWDITGQVYHTNFLVSTEELRKNDHNAYDFDSYPTDTTYDNYFWQDVESGFVKLNDELYYTDTYIDTEGQYVLIKRYSDKKTLYKKKHYWMASSDWYYPGNYARLAVCGSKLLFSLSDGIYSFNPKNNEVKKIHSKPNLSGYYNIYGFTYANGELVYDLATKPNFDVNTKKYYEYRIEYHDPGNINDDGYVNLEDAVALARTIAGWQVDCNNNALDVNGDGNKNLNDLVHLAQYLAEWDGIVLH